VMTSTSGKSRATASLVPSVDPLSTRITRWTIVWPRRCSRQLVVRS
jgi:hypothetical protein